MLPADLKDALRIVSDALPVDKVNWAVAGRASLNLQGIHVETRDLDILTSSKCAYEIERRLRPYVMKSVEYAEDTSSCSHFGLLSINGVNSEIIGSPQVRDDEGNWLPCTDVVMNRHFIEVDGTSVPVTTLDYEAQALRSAGDSDAADLVGSFLENKAGV
jgi:hypothetical protein